MIDREKWPETNLAAVKKWFLQIGNALIMIVARVFLKKRKENILFPMLYFTELITPLLVSLDCCNIQQSKELQRKGREQLIISQHLHKMHSTVALQSSFSHRHNLLKIIKILQTQSSIINWSLTLLTSSNFDNLTTNLLSSQKIHTYQSTLLFILQVKQFYDKKRRDFTVTSSRQNDTSR